MRSLPNYVQREFEEFLTCDRLEHGFLRVGCEECKHECLVAFSCKRRGLCPSCGARRMAESAALLVEDVFPREPMRQWVLSFPFQLRFLFASDLELMGKVLGIVYRGLQTLPPLADSEGSGQAVKVAGFSLHAGVVAEPHRRDKLERFCRYVSRPAVSEKRMALTPNGKIRYPLKTPCRDGTTHVLFESQDFIARLATLAPKPRVDLTRFHGVFAANSKHRTQVTPGKRGKGRGHAKVAANHWLEKTPQERHRAMTWMQRLKRVFGIDIETCERCGVKVKVIASIEAPAVIAHILKHLKQKDALKADIQPH